MEPPRRPVLSRPLARVRGGLLRPPGPLPLPFDRSRPAHPTGRGATVEFEIDPAQVAAAEALEARAAFAEAGDAYVKLADLPDVDRRGALDRAHMNYDSAYLETNHPSRLCWALGVAEQVVREGGFQDDDQASYWRENVEDDLRRLQQDAKATERANCRFDASGAPRKVVLTTLTDDDFIA